MKKQIFCSSLVIIAVVLFSACNKDKVKKDVFSGYAQKGPFIKGSSVTISELDANLNQTGKTFITTISDNSGSFELTGIELVSNYVQLKVDGYYFNEFEGEVFEPITLYALVDIKDVNSANVNVLTHLERPRVEYLVKQEKKSFSQAKKQAQSEVLAIFGLTPSNMTSEALNLTNNGMLLAISSILTASFNAEMMEIMGKISEGIRTDGKLDDTDLGKKLMDNAYASFFSRDNIRKNMETKYAELGLNVSIPDFESYLELFVNSKLYPHTEYITYPAKGSYGDNILSDAVTTVKRGQNYSMYAELQGSGYFSLTIDILCAKFTDFYYKDPQSYTNWRIESYKGNEVRFRTETGNNPTGTTDMLVQVLSNEDYITIEYRECRPHSSYPASPTKTKTLRVIP